MKLSNLTLAAGAGALTLGLAAFFAGAFLTGPALTEVFARVVRVVRLTDRGILLLQNTLNGRETATIAVRITHRN